MEIVQLYVCSKCKEVIHPGGGFIIHGNVYIVPSDLDARHGIIGNNFPDCDGDGNISLDDINEVAYHSECVLTILQESL